MFDRSVRSAERPADFCAFDFRPFDGSATVRQPFGRTLGQRLCEPHVAASDPLQEEPLCSALIAVCPAVQRSSSPSPCWPSWRRRSPSSCRIPGHSRSCSWRWLADSGQPGNCRGRGESPRDRGSKSVSVVFPDGSRPRVLGSLPSRQARIWWLSASTRGGSRRYRCPWPTLRPQRARMCSRSARRSGLWELCRRERALRLRFDFDVNVGRWQFSPREYSANCIVTGIHENAHLS